MVDKALSNRDSWYASVDKTSETDDARIQNITVLPPPEHLIRFFPIQGTEVENLISNTRQKIRDIMHKKDDRLLSSLDLARFMILKQRWNMHTNF